MDVTFTPFDILAIIAALAMLGVVLFYRPKARKP
jgi:hypothetical protein